MNRRARPSQTRAIHLRRLHSRVKAQQREAELKLWIALDGKDEALWAAVAANVMKELSGSGAKWISKQSTMPAQRVAEIRLRSAETKTRQANPWDARFPRASSAARGCLTSRAERSCWTARTRTGAISCRSRATE